MTATTSSGFVSQNNDGTFSVSGNHIYTDSPTPYALTVTIKDAGGQSQVVSTTSIFVPDAPIAAVAIPLNPVPLPGNRFNALVATFSTTNPIPNPSSFSATIDWGDGTIDPGLILPDGNVFDVRGSHVYAEGDYVLAINISDVGGSKAQAYTSLSVPDAPLAVSVPSSIAAVEGTPITQAVATFTSGNPLAVAGNFQASIDWGDGTATPEATITVGAGGVFSIYGSHAYEAVGTFPIDVTILSAGGTSADVLTQGAVADAPLAGQVVLGYAPKIGVSASPTLFAFLDNDPNQAAVNYSASIDWGDGTPQTSGTITADPSQLGRFLVSGTHTYTEVGPETITADITDAGGASVVVKQTVTTADPPILATFTPFSLTAGQLVTSQVAAFVDQNPYISASNFSAIITWGDGTTDVGTVSSIGNSNYIVTGNHSYAVAGSPKVVVSLGDNAGATATVSGNASIAVRITDPTGFVVGMNSSGATNSNTPSFAGTAGPGDIVTVMGQRSDMPAPFVIGQVVTSYDGTWSLTSAKLLDGTYAITVATHDSLGHISGTPASLPSLVIDSAPPRVTGVSLNPKAGVAVITIQDDRSGLIDSELANPGNYSLYLSTATGNQRIGITAITVSPGGPTDVRTIVLTFASNNTAKGRRKLTSLKAGKYVLSINGNNISDNAGNALSETFFTVNPPSHPSASSTYIAQLITNGSAPANPVQVHIKSGPKPKAPKVHHHK